MKFSTEEREVLMEHQDYIDENVIGVISVFYRGDK